MHFWGWKTRKRGLIMPIYESKGFGNDLHCEIDQFLTISQRLDLGECHKV